MALILSLEASARFCSAAIHRSGVLLADYIVSEERSAAAQLAPAIQTVLEKAHVRPDQLQAVAVAEGPGSYTGLRIASSTAKGICMALHIPLLAVNTLQTLAHTSKRSVGSDDFLLYCPLLDARRMEVYAQWLDQDLNPLSGVSAVILSAGCFDEQLNRGAVLFVGDAVAKAQEALQHPNAAFLLAEPDAAAVGELAWPMFENQQFQELSSFEPRYLKEFIAGRKPV